MLTLYKKKSFFLELHCLSYSLAVKATCFTQYLRYLSTKGEDFSYIIPTSTFIDFNTYAPPLRLFQPPRLLERWEYIKKNFLALGNLAKLMFLSISSYKNWSFSKLLSFFCVSVSPVRDKSERIERKFKTDKFSLRCNSDYCVWKVSKYS